MQSKVALFFQEFPFLNTICKPEKVRWTKVERIDLELIDRRVLDPGTYGPFKCSFGIFDSAGGLLKRVDLSVPWYAYFFPPFTIFIWHSLFCRMTVKDVIRGLGSDATRAHSLAIYEGRAVTVFKPAKKVSLLDWIDNLSSEERQKIQAEI